MDQYARQPLGGFRFQLYEKTLTLLNVDLTGATFRMQSRLRPNTPGGPLFDLATVTSAAAQGIRLIYGGTATIDAHLAAGRLESIPPGKQGSDALAMSILGIRVNLTTMRDMPYSGEVGEDSVFAYDMQVAPAGGNAKVWFAGDFEVWSAVTGADDAPTGYASGFGQARQRRAAGAGSSQFQIGTTVIQVTIGPPQGPRGLASGPLGAGSVDAETITDDPTAQAEVLDKLTLEGVSAAARLLDADPARTLASASPAATATIDFTRSAYTGDRPAIVRTVGAPLATMNGSNQFEVDAPLDDATKRVFLPGYRFREGRVRIRCVQGRGMISFVDRTFAGRTIYMVDGALKYGWRNGATFGGDYNAGEAGALPGADGDLIWIELVTGPARAGLGYQLRTWKDGDPYPTSAVISNTYPDTNRFNEGAIMLSSFSGTTLKVLAIRIDDGGAGDAEVLANIATVGRWFPRLEGGGIVMCTIRGGSVFRSRVTGTTGVDLVYLGAADAPPAPVLDCFINGVRYGGPQTLTAAAGAAATVSYPSGLDPARVYDIEWRVRGIAEGADKFGKGSGLQMLRVKPTTAGGVVAPWPDNRRRILFIGDSTTEAINARGSPTSPSNSGGDVSWPKLSAESVGRSAIISAFGGTGLLVGNDSNQPPAEDGITYSGALYPFGHAVNYMYDREIDTVAENIEAVVINLGINDAAKGIAATGAGGFQPAYVKFLQEQLIRHPRARKIIAMRPFNGAFAAQIVAAVAAVADPRLYYLDTSGWTDIPTTDGIHPSVIGHANAAAHMGPVLAALLP